MDNQKYEKENYLIYYDYKKQQWTLNKKLLTKRKKELLKSS